MTDVRVNYATIRSRRPASEIYQTLENSVDMIGRKLTPSLIVTGQPGLGKTHRVLHTLKASGLKEDQDYAVAKGRCTAPALYRFLYFHRDSVVVLDDMDSVLKSEDSVNILKAGLDSYGKRTISYITAKTIRDADGEELPNQFDFKGGIIFISNLTMAKMDGALKSRSLCIDLSLSAEQIIKYMTEIYKEIDPDTSLDEQGRLEAMQTVIAVWKTYNDVELNLRSLIKAIRIRAAGFPEWRRMVAEQITRS